MKYFLTLLAMLTLPNLSFSQSAASCTPVSLQSSEESRIGYEILQIVSPNEIVTWMSRDITQEEFDAIELPPNWFKNQPRAGDANSGEFAGSPGAASGSFIEQEHFGHQWTHVATVIDSNLTLDAEGLLRANIIEKSHTLVYNAGRTVPVIVSPENEIYIRVSRDAGRCDSVPTMPDEWRLMDITLTEDAVIELPNPTTNIRADNEDSFQGPAPVLASYLSKDQAVGENSKPELNTSLIYDVDNNLQLFSVCAVIDSNLENPDGSNKDFPAAASLLLDINEDESSVSLLYANHIPIELDENGYFGNKESARPCPDRIEIFSNEDNDVVNIIYASSSVPVGEQNVSYSVLAQLDPDSSNTPVLLVKDAQESTLFLGDSCENLGDFGSSSPETITSDNSSLLTLELPTCGETQMTLRINGAAFKTFSAGENASIDLSNFPTGEFALSVKPYDAHYLAGGYAFDTKKLIVK